MARSVMAGQGLVRAVVVLFCVVCCAGVGVSAAAAASVSQFGGGEGSGAGQFSEPQGVAVDQESGDVYVVDRNDSRVEKFGGEGTFLFAWGWGVADGHTQAAQTCTSSCFAGLEGAGAGQFSFPEGVAVDNDTLSSSRGDVYVFDFRNIRVEKFDSMGTFLLAFGHEVNATTHGDVCLAGESCQAGTQGTGAGEFEPGEGYDIAVGPGGTVFVGDENRVQRFSPGGVLEGQTALPGVGRVTALAVDSGGDVYVTGTELGGVRKFDGAGTELGEPRDALGAPAGIAVGSGDELFVDENAGGHHLLEFTPSGVEVASFDARPQGGGHGIAVGDAAGGVYVLEPGVVRLVSPPAAGPLVLSGSVVGSEPQPTTATLNATINPEGHETSYHFEYGTSSAYGTSTPPGTLEGNFEDQPVNAALSGLQPRTTYHFRIVASNSAGTFFGPDETFVTLPPVLIESESVSQVAASSAVLATQINPLGSDTSYRFEYGPTTGYGTSVPVPDEDIGSGTEGIARSAVIEGLSPNTSYHYRVVAHNALGTVEGADRVFHTQSGQGQGLLDGRAWEMVSPPDKHGAALEGIGSLDGGLIQAAGDGHAITYVASAPVEADPQGNRSFVYTQILSTRGSAGWSSQGITLPNEAPTGLDGNKTSEYEVFSDDLSVGLVQPAGSTPLSPAASEATPYRREANGDYTPLVTAANVLPGVKFGGAHSIERARFVGASSDLNHVVVSSPLALTQDAVAVGGGKSLYEWTGGSLQLVSVLPNEKPAAEEGLESELGSPQSGDVRHAVSEDGSAVFWTGIAGGPADLYMRDLVLGKTVQLDTVEEGAQGGAPEQGASFQMANSDGSKVFFTDDTKLTKDSTSVVRKPDLYMCEIEEAMSSPRCKLKDLTAGGSGEAADVQGNVIGADEDGRYVYFVAAGALTAGADPGGRNLYLYDTSTGTRRLIAALSGEDISDWSEAEGDSHILTRLTARVSPNGRYLAFMSERSLTGYDNIDARSGQPDEEVFLYDVSTGRVVCASCNPSGARPAGMFDATAIVGPLVDRPGSWEGHWLAASVPGWTNAVATGGEEVYHQARYLSDSGRLFFDAADGLVPGDTNGTEDVYEYEPGGVGGCAGAGGCVGLVSSGASGEESAVVDASGSGDDVFFLTASRLAGQDLDGSLDVYDARVCSSVSPCVGGQSGSMPACSSSDSCRGLNVTQSEGSVAPGSVSVSGVGNLAPPTSRPAVKTKRLTRAQKLANALRSCKRKAKRRRASCVARAHRLYGKGAGASVSRRAGTMSKGNR